MLSRAQGVSHKYAYINLEKCEFLPLNGRYSTRIFFSEVCSVNIQTACVFVEDGKL